MRDNNEGMTEILHAFERDGQYFCAVRLARRGEIAGLEFGVSEAGYYAVKRILSARPFDSLPGVPCRYFFGGSYTGASAGTNMFTFAVRIEQNNRAKQVEFRGPQDLLANLLWLQELPSVREAAHLRRVSVS